MTMTVSAFATTPRFGEALVPSYRPVASNDMDRGWSHPFAASARGLPFGWIGHTAKQAERDGLKVRRALSDAGVAPRIDDTTSLDPAEFLLMCALVINGVDDEMHGMSRTPMVRGTASMVCRATALEKNLAGAISVVARFFRMVGGFCDIELDVSAKMARIKIRSNSDEGHSAHIVEEMMAHFLELHFSYLLDRPLPLSGFTTRSIHHPFVNRLHPYLLCPVTAGSVTSISFPAAFLAFPCHARVEELPLWDAKKFWLQHHPAMGRTPENWRGNKDFSLSVHQMLQDANITIEECGEALGLPLSELRRRLASEGTNFRQIRRDAMIARAKAHLESGTPTEDVAMMLGYSDSRSFRRAMKLAGGGSIQELRSAALFANDDFKPQVMEQLRAQCLHMQ